MQKSRSLLLVVIVLAGLFWQPARVRRPRPPPPPARRPQPQKPPQKLQQTRVAPAGAKRVGYAVPDASNPFLANLTKSVTDYFAKDGVQVHRGGRPG